jgi:hypothetical protein
MFKRRSGDGYARSNSEFDLGSRHPPLEENVKGISISRMSFISLSIVGLKISDNNPEIINRFNRVLEL